MHVACRRVVDGVTGFGLRAVAMNVAGLVMAKGHANARRSHREPLQGHRERYREQEGETEELARHWRRFYKSPFD
jgi:hypothetical protein